MLLQIDLHNRLVLYVSLLVLAGIVVFKFIPQKL